MAKLSARERAAKAAGVATDYTKSASEQGKSKSTTSSVSVSPRKKGESAREFQARSTGGTLNYNTGEITPGASKSAPATPSKVGSLEDAKSFINANQMTDAASGSEVSVRASTARYQEIANELGLGDKMDMSGDAPEAPKYEDTYLGLRGDYGVDTLETKLNDLTAQEEALAEQARVNKGANQGKAVAMGVIGGRISEQQQQAQDQMDFIGRQKNTIQNELNTKYAVIDKIIQLKGMDYDTAKTQYDTKFSQAVQVFNMVKGIDDTIKTDQERLQENSRANLQIIYNNIANNPDGWKSLDKSTQTMVAKLEMTAGLPMGTFTSIAAKNPGGEIITTDRWQDASGKEYVSVVTKDKNGQFKTSNMLLGQGKVSGGSGGSDEEKDIDKFYAQADKLVEQMTNANTRLSWSDAWSRLKSQFPSASTETIDNALGLKNRDKYDK